MGRPPWIGSLSDWTNGLLQSSKIEIRIYIAFVALSSARAVLFTHRSNLCPSGPYGAMWSRVTEIALTSVWLVIVDVLRSWGWFYRHDDRTCTVSRRHVPERKDCAVQYKVGPLAVWNFASSVAVLDPWECIVGIATRNSMSGRHRRAGAGGQQRTPERYRVHLRV